MKEKTERNKRLVEKYQNQRKKNYHALARMFKLDVAAVWRIINRKEKNEGSRVSQESQEDQTIII